MSRTFLAAAAATSLLASAAIAQTSAPPASSTPDTKAPQAQSAPNNATANMNKPQIIEMQKPDQFLASNFTGADVYGPDNKKIGDVTDVVFDRSGNIQAVVVGVGGFLGIGSKDVAVTMDSLQIQRGNNDADPKLVLAMSKDDLQKAAEFKPHKPASTAATSSSPNTTGSTRTPATR